MRGEPGTRPSSSTTVVPVTSRSQTGLGQDPLCRAPPHTVPPHPLSPPELPAGPGLHAPPHTTPWARSPWSPPRTSAGPHQPAWELLLYRSVPAPSSSPIRTGLFPLLQLWFLE